MARAPTTLDPFAAIAEPKRRQVLAAIAAAGARGACPVALLVATLGWPQPQVSKHLAVLREVGLVSVTQQGRQRMYSVNGEQLKPIYDWVRSYERFWTHQLDRVKARAERLARERAEKPKSNSQEKHP